MVKNIAASVKDRLLNQARRSDDDFNELLDCCDLPEPFPNQVFSVVQ